MAPKHSPTGKLQRRTAFPPDLGEAEDRAKEVPSKSQELEDLDVAQMAQQMMNATKDRRLLRRKNAMDDYSKVAKRLQDEICISFDETSKRISRLHKLRFQRLFSLLQKKADIEERILASNKKLEKAFLAANKELRVTFGERSKDAGGHEGVDFERDAI